MKYRTLGSTSLQVSEIGFGAWQLGNEKDWGEMSENEAISLVHHAMNQGCTFFDTAPNYGAGKSEELLGKALIHSREKVVINTKIGHHPNQVVDFDVSKLRTSIESSLQRLQTDYVDTLLLHNPPFSCLQGRSAQFELLDTLKNEGKIRAYGASVDTSEEMLEILEHTNAQVIEVMFNIFYQEPLKAFQKAKEKNVGLIIKVPLDSGWLSGKYHQDSVFTGIRSRWSKEQIKRRQDVLGKLQPIIGNESIVQTALRFILAFEEVSTVIPGARDDKQLTENLAASKGKMSAEARRKIQTFWQEEIEPSPLGW
ncbi:aryl-alcohol dehydrogenase-like predicted oxidoreductase [Bacillus mesophilus]|uniref:Aldo/keto reductase n=1 Tax=Bacillus mesophilus TaxID=1808955 RepID=A0A6M0QD73_9BACI|nr:aldo/keto reductase [Bacillus mesophilus]MBM7662921.1 aryl-alcohol dehydrogenase-like predicted oxidoreductase [Bacillus mesophilus]NEY73510.1 aldo/keto reductase [Bacillus mesophilus]